MAVRYGITSQGARSESRLSVEVPVEQAAAAVQQAVEGLQRFTVVETSPSGARLKARMNNWTWGGQITLRFHSVDPDRTVIEALCEPSLGTTLIDYRQGGRDLRASLGAIGGRLNGVNHVPWRSHHGNPELPFFGKKVLRPGLRSLSSETPRLAQK